VTKEGPTGFNAKRARLQRKEGGIRFRPDDIWYTAKGNAVYAVTLAVPEDDRLRVRAMRASRSRR
jgi:hypothetical protein